MRSVRGRFASLREPVGISRAGHTFPICIAQYPLIAQFLTRYIMFSLVTTRDTRGTLVGTFTCWKEQLPKEDSFGSGNNTLKWRDRLIEVVAGLHCIRQSLHAQTCILLLHKFM